MKKTLLSCIFFASAMIANAQGRVSNETLILDAAEDTTQVTTIADIIDIQERVTTQNSNAAHKKNVWGRKTYLNLSYMMSASLNPSEKIDLGYDKINNGIVPNFKADKGVALQIGHSYALHKKPIANVVQFNIDYTFIDLSAVQYKKEKGDKLYDSSNTWELPKENQYSRTETRQYIPWALEKWDFNYGMNLGPSITIAPFTYLSGVPGLHYMKLKAYYHIGYQVGVMYIKNDKKADVAYTQSENQYVSDYQDNLKLNFSHGLTQSFGFNLSWKVIGVGYETRWDKRTYMSVTPSIFGDKDYKFKGNSSRVYIQFCY
ncbi:MAG: hypothetical protein NC095_01470 [Muribaculum sp.]|nr:hypothetical protein [Muribaculum sp.]